MFDDEDEVDAFIQDLVDMGLLIEHINNDGEKMYEISQDTKELSPMLWETHLSDIKRAIYRQWQHGMVDIMFSEEGDMQDSVSLTEKAFDPEEVAKIPYEDQLYLKHLIKAFETNFPE